MAHPGHQVLPLVLFSSAVFSLCTSRGMCSTADISIYLLLTALPLQFAVPSFNVSSDQCVAPTLNYNALTEAGQDVIFIYTMSPFTSCSGSVVRYWFCYQNTSSNTGGRVNISTVLLLEDRRDNYQVVGEFNVEAEPGEDSCLPGSPTDGQCCVTRNLSAENQFEVNSSYLYGVVDLPGGPNMIQTHSTVSGRPGYQRVRSAYNPSSVMLMKQGWDQLTNQSVKIFQFVVGKLILKAFTNHLFVYMPIYAFTCFSDISTSDTSTSTTPTSSTNTFSSSSPSSSTYTQAPTLPSDTSSSPTDTSSTMVSCGSK